MYLYSTDYLLSRNFGAFLRNSVVQVSTVKVGSLTVENSVTCSGRVERIATTNVYATAASLVKMFISK